MKKFYIATASILFLLFLTQRIIAESGQNVAQPVNQTSNIINIADYGAIANDRRNTVKAVQKAILACRQVQNPLLVFPKGRYDFWPQHCIEKVYYESNTTDINPKRLAILIKHFTDLVIDGQDSDFIFHDRMQPFTIDSSENITIKNVNIDWDIPLSAEAEVVDTSAYYIDLLLDPVESPFLIEEQKLYFTGEGWKSRWWAAMEFDKNTRHVAYNTGDRGCLGGGWNEYRAEQINTGKVRLHHQFKRKPAIGNYLVLRHNNRDHAGIFIRHSNEITIENVNLFHSAGLGLLAQFSSNITLDNYNAIPNPQKYRILSGHDDGAHFSNCKDQITIKNCEFRALMDDPVNVHGTSVRIIEKISENRLLCKFMHHQSVGMAWARVEDKIGFIENEGMITVGKREIKSFIVRNTELFEVHFTEPVPDDIQPGDALENLTWSPDVTIQNCHFGSTRARGLLISTPGEVLIEGNVFESSGSAILIAGDANYWYESGAVSDVCIRNNTFKESCLTSMYQFCEAIISIYPEIPKPEISRKAFHRNIRIEGNDFQPFDYPLLYAKSVDNITFTNNHIIRSYAYQPFHHRKYMFTFEWCSNVSIGKNDIDENALGKNVFLKDMSAEDLFLEPDQGLHIQYEAEK